MKRGELIYTLDDIHTASNFLYDQLIDHGIMTFTGVLGAGKTTLIQAVLREAGITDSIQSPTFSYVNSYVSSTGRTFHHFDLYRIDTVHQFISHGFHEYLAEQNAYLLIEWPEVIHTLLPAKTYWVAIDLISEQARRMRYETAL